MSNTRFRPEEGKLDHNSRIRFNSMLVNKFEKAAPTVTQAEEDVDVLIINMAILLCSTFYGVFIISEDVDVLGLPTALALTS